MLVDARVAERYAHQVSGRAGGVGLEHLGRPEVATSIEGACGQRGQAAGPDMGPSGDEVFACIGVDPINVRLSRSEHEQVGDQIERAHVESAVRADRGACRG